MESLIPSKNVLFGEGYSQVCAYLYRSYQRAKQLGPTTIWGDKNNAYHNYIDVLTYLYPNARFMHVVRDGRAVLNSIQQLEFPTGQKYAPRLSAAARQASLEWTDTLSRVERHLKRYAPGRHITVRYEDVLTDFEAQIREVCHFLSIEYESGMSEFSEKNRRHGLEPTKYSWKKNTFRPIDTSRLAMWRQELNENTIKEFERYAARKLECYDYALACNEREICDLYSATTKLKSQLREWLRHVRLNLVAMRGMIR